jgi:hypothetical protein
MMYIYICMIHVYMYIYLSIRVCRDLQEAEGKTENTAKNSNKKEKKEIKNDNFSTKILHVVSSAEDLRADRQKLSVFWLQLITTGYIMYIYVHKYLYTYIHTYMYIHTRIYMYINIYICICIHVCI